MTQVAQRHLPGQGILAGPKVRDQPSHSIPDNIMEDSVCAPDRGRPVLLFCHEKHLVRNLDMFFGSVHLQYPVWDFLCVMEPRAVVQFFPLMKLSAQDIRSELGGICGHETLCLSAMMKRRKRFVNGRISLEDDPSSGRST
jgi:hypothetical protein